MIVIPNIIFVILIVIVTGYLTFVTAKGSLTDNRHSNLWKRLTKRGKQVFYIYIILIIIIAIQEYNTQNSNTKSNLLLEKERNDRDSIITTGIKTGVDSSNNKLFRNLSKAFADQNLKIDTLKNTITKLKNAPKKTVNNYPQEDPVLMIEQPNGVKLRSKKDTKYDFELHFRSFNAGSTNYKVITYILIEYIDGTYSFFIPEELLSNTIKIPEDLKWTTGFQFDNSRDLKNIYLHLKGKYSTIDKTKSYNIDDVYIYEELTQEISILINPKRDKAIGLINNFLNKK